MLEVGSLLTSTVGMRVDKDGTALGDIVGIHVGGVEGDIDGAAKIYFVAHSCF